MDTSYIPPYVYPTHTADASSRECVTNVFGCGVGVVVHGGIPESRPELLPSGTAMLVEDLNALGHLHHDQGRLV